MNMLIPASLVCLCAASPLAAQQGRLKIDHLKALIPKAASFVDVDLDGSALRAASGELEKDPATKAVLKDLSGVFVKVLKFDRPGVYAPSDAAIISAQLKGPEWQPILQVKDKNEEVGIYILAKTPGGSAGFAIFVAEPKELVVVNIVGPVDLEKLALLEGKLGIPKLGLGKGGSKSGRN